MRLLITGASGLLGGNVLGRVPADWEVVAVTHRHPLTSASPRIRIVNADLTDPEAVLALDAYGPFDAIIHAAALTNVEQCEQDKPLANLLNVEMSRSIAQFAQQRGIQAILISTDHFFDGITGNYDELALPTPINYYAQTKFEAEACFQKNTAPVTIVRTNFFGWNIQPKQDLAGWIVESLRNHTPIRLFTDVFFSPLLVTILVDRLVDILNRKLTGVINVAASDGCSKYAFGVRLAELFNLNQGLITPISIKDSDLKVPRPNNMTLNTNYARNILGLSLPTVEASLLAYHALSLTDYPTRLRSLAAHNSGRSK